MNVRTLAVCAFRLIGLWCGFQFVWSVVGNFVLSRELGDFFFLPWTVYVSALAILAGFAWIYADELGQWAASAAHNGVESGLKLGASFFVALWLAPSLEVLTMWLIAQPRNGREGMALIVEGIEGDTHAYAGIALVVLAVVCLFVARPLGRAIAIRDRLAELASEPLDE